jgi:twinfilin-like protein
MSQSVNITTEILMLNFLASNISPTDVANRIPTELPSFTFYRHPETNLLYFIFCSPDSASVQQRMKHTVSIPGLVNVHAQDSGVHVDQKLEIHDPGDLTFEGDGPRIGKFRSVYLRNRFEGTDSVYENMTSDKAFLDAVV